MKYLGHEFGVDVHAHDNSVVDDNQVYPLQRTRHRRELGFVFVSRRMYRFDGGGGGTRALIKSCSGHVQQFAKPHSVHIRSQ